MFGNVQTQKYKECTGENVQTENKMVGGEAGNNTMTKWCAGQVTENGQVGHSSEPLGARWDEELTNM